MTKAEACSWAEEISAGEWGDEYRAPVEARDRVVDLVSRFPLGSRVEWNHGGNERWAIVRGHDLHARFPRPWEVLVLALDDGRVVSVLASGVTRADENGVADGR
ncbi:hypothetical protein [Nocardia sp. NPDC051570]|uniref:hypothetical protein n=1 Tax=Nocardia sp. NPDC051570 TaxID=3364324 RepID=UPI0037935107